MFGKKKNKEEKEAPKVRWITMKIQNDTYELTIEDLPDTKYHPEYVETDFVPDPGNFFKRKFKDKKTYMRIVDATGHNVNEQRSYMSDSIDAAMIYTYLYSNAFSKFLVGLGVHEKKIPIQIVYLALIGLVGAVIVTKIMGMW